MNLRTSKLNPDRPECFCASKNVSKEKGVYAKINPRSLSSLTPFDTFLRFSSKNSETLRAIGIGSLHFGSIFLIILTITFSACALTVTPEQTQSIAQKIWLNECKGNIVGLTTWRDGEKCASLGIGHFIWYPAGKKDRFHETFPDLVRFLTQRHISLPAWLTPTSACPWSSRKAFYADIESKRMHELRSLLIRTINDQGLFIIKRFEETVPAITNTLSPRDAQHVTAVIDQLAATPQGLYALIDYLNFKGAGTDPQERYHGKGWGLTQVLLATKKDAPNSLEAFAQAAKKILTQRVHNAPKKQLENQWLKGWLNRVETYTKI